MIKFILPIILLVMLVSPAAAELMAEADLSVRYNSWHIAYDINNDGSYLETQKWSGTVLKESALESNKKAYVTFSTSVAKGEILDAYTLKKSGQRIDVPKSSYQVTVNSGYKNASPLYSDETTISVLFPDLAVGDTVFLSYRITNTVGIFPNQFSAAHNFSRYKAYDDIVVEVSAPASMQLKQQSFFLKADKPVVRDGRQLLRWTYQNKTPEKWTPADNGISKIGENPSLYLSTFKNYREITDAYGSRATPKAAVTDRVKQLAKEIVADRNRPEAQAQALYNWVTRNISYGGNCIGIGAVVPRDLDVVLDNKQGDCKDHATLLQALLAAKNIVSEQALINAGLLYQLPEIPVVSAVNHVISYIPAFNLFLDSTSSIMPYGILPDTLGEKPVLLVSNFKEGLKTPATAQNGNEQLMQTRLRINENGSATGETSLQLKGLPGIGARAVWRLIPREQEELIAGRMLESQGIHGTATLQKDDPAELLDSYRISISYKLEDFIPVGSATGLAVRPVVLSYFPISGFLHNAYEPLPNKDHTCSGGASIEEYELEFPSQVKIVSVPKDIEIKSRIIDYQATYRQTANSIRIRRELRDKTATNICSPQYATEYKKIMLNIAKDLKAQILISD